MATSNRIDATDRKKTGVFILSPSRAVSCCGSPSSNITKPARSPRIIGSPAGSDQLLMLSLQETYGYNGGGSGMSGKVLALVMVVHQDSAEK
jgi:hypothetical protein